MDVDSFLSDPLSRRRFFHRSGIAVVGGSAVFLTACGDDTTSPNARTAPDESDEADSELLNSALDLELMAVAAYKAAAGHLKGDVLQIGKLFLSQEQEHADALASAIRKAGYQPHRSLPSYDFPTLSSQDGALRFAMHIENVAIAAYIDALPKFGKGDLCATASSIVANEAEHIAVLLGVLGEQQVPSAFVFGQAA